MKISIKSFFILTVILLMTQRASDVIADMLENLYDHYYIRDISDYWYNIVDFEKVAIIFFSIIAVLKFCCDNEFLNSLFQKIVKYKYRIIIFVAFLGVAIDYLTLIYFLISPFLIFYIIKKYYSDIPAIQDTMVNFSTAKNYLLVYIILELPLLLLLLCVTKIEEFLWFIIFFYMRISCMLWYIPCVLMSYISSKKTKKEIVDKEIENAGA